MLAEITTIDIPAWSIYATTGVIIGLPMLLLLRRKCLNFQDKNREEREKAEQLKEEEKQKELKQLFPYPWLWAYEQCCQMEHHKSRQIWFNQWLQKRNPQYKLPLLSSQAITKFAEMIAKSSSDKDFVALSYTLNEYLKIEEPAPAEDPYLKKSKEDSWQTRAQFYREYIEDKKTEQAQQCSHQWQSRGSSSPEKDYRECIKCKATELLADIHQQQCHYDPNNKEVAEGYGCEQCRNIQIAAMKECLRHIDSPQDRSRIEQMIQYTKKLPYVNNPPEGHHGQIMRYRDQIEQLEKQANDYAREAANMNSAFLERQSTIKALTKQLAEAEKQLAEAELGLQSAAIDLKRAEDRNEALDFNLDIELENRKRWQEEKQKLQEQIQRLQELQEEIVNLSPSRRRSKGIKETQDETGNHNWKYSGTDIRICLHCAKQELRQGNELWSWSLCRNDDDALEGIEEAPDTARGDD